MLIGFNNDVEFNGNFFHIQTEDHGLKDSAITTILFFSGQILDSKRVSYKPSLEGIEDEEEQKKAIRKRMVELHREFYKKLFDGQFEKRVAEITKEGKGGGEKKGEEATEAPQKLKGKRTKATQPVKPTRVDPDDFVPSTLVEQVSQQPRNPERLKMPDLELARPPLPRAVAVEPMIAQSWQATGRRAFRGFEWPEIELRIDGLVAQFLESVQ